MNTSLPSNEVKGNYAATIDFLLAFYPDGPWCLSAFDPEKQKPSVTQTFFKGEQDNMLSWLSVHSKRNLHFHVNEVSGRLSEKASKDEIARVCYLHLDIDPDKTKDLDGEQIRIQALLSEEHIANLFLPQPTFVIFSGGGYQAFWRMETPWPVNGDAEEVERYNLQIAKLFNADTSTRNIDRVMRLPGTVNWPTKVKRDAGRVPALAKLVRHNPEAVYAWESFTKAPSGATSTPAQTEITTWRRSPLPRIEVAGWGDGPDLGSLDVPNWVKIVIALGHDPDKPWHDYSDRSDVVWSVVCALAEHNINGDIVKGILLDETWAISKHIYEQGKPEQYVDRQISRSRDPAHNARLTKPLAKPARFVKLAPIPDELPARPWIVKGLLLRKEITILSGAGGAGKSAWALGLADALGKGKAFGHLPEPSQSCRVLFITSEDSLVENQLRLKAREIVDREPASENVWVLGDNRDIALLTVPRGAERGEEPRPSQLASDLKAFIRDERIDVVILDPFVETYSGLQESDNNQMRDVMTYLRDLTGELNIALMILHHDRKGNGEGSTADNARGASAIINAARFHYALIKMTDADAKKFSVTNPGPYVRFAFGKSNRVARADDNWYAFQSVTLPNGEDVGHIGLSQLSTVATDLDRIVDMIRDGRDGDGLSPYLVSNRNNPERTDEVVVLRRLAATTIDATKAIRRLEQEGRIEQATWRNPETRKEVKVWRVP